MISSLLLALALPKWVPGHSHNDYEREVPLSGALDLGFGSLEVDLFLVDGELLVAHDRDKVNPQRTLRSMYFRPLQARLANRASFYEGGEPLQLMVDIKAQGREVLPILIRQMKEFPSLFQMNRKGAVRVVISGDRPIELILADPEKWTAIDGRLGDLGGSRTPEEMPLISDSWLSHFTWRGVGPIPNDQRQKLAGFVKKVSAEKRRLRFWAIPDTASVWKVLREEKVHWIGTDRAALLHKLLTAGD